MLSFGVPVPTPMFTTAWVAGVQIAMVLPEITMITAMRSAATVPISIGVPIAGRWTSLERLLLARRFPNGAKDAMLLIDPNLLGGRLPHLLDWLGLLNLLDLSLAPFEPVLLRGFLRRLRRTHDNLLALRAFGAFLALRTFLRSSGFGAFSAALGALCTLLIATLALMIAILRHHGGWHHHARHQQRD